MNKQTRSRLSTGNKLMVGKWEGGEGLSGKGEGIKKYKLVAKK